MKGQQFPWAPKPYSHILFLSINIKSNCAHSHLPCTLQLPGSPSHSSQGPAQYCLPEYSGCCRSQNMKMIHCYLYSNQCSYGCVPMGPSDCHTAQDRSCYLVAAVLLTTLTQQNKQLVTRIWLKHCSEIHVRSVQSVLTYDINLYCQQVIQHDI